MISVLEVGGAGPLLGEWHLILGSHLKQVKGMGGSFLGAQMVKNLSAVQETQVQSLGREDPLKEGMATHSGILA